MNASTATQTRTYVLAVDCTVQLGAGHYVAQTVSLTVLTDDELGHLERYRLGEEVGRLCYPGAISVICTLVWDASVFLEVA